TSFHRCAGDGCMVCGQRTAPMSFSEEIIMVKAARKFLLVVLAALALAALWPLTAEEPRSGVALQLGTVQETEAKARIGEPNYGYVGQLGSFVVSREQPSLGLIVVHNFPDTETMSLGRTELTYEGSKRLGNVDGWVFKTQWDGKAYPSKIFFSAEKVYFGGGVNAHIAADYRDKTGWGWEPHPLRRVEPPKKGNATE